MGIEFARRQLGCPAGIAIECPVGSPEKGKAAAKQGRKAMGLWEAAGLPVWRDG